MKGNTASLKFTWHVGAFEMRSKATKIHWIVVQGPSRSSSQIFANMVDEKGIRSISLPDTVVDTWQKLGDIDNWMWVWFAPVAILLNL